MSVLLMLMDVMLMHCAPTLWGASLVPVTMDTVGMVSLALVGEVIRIELTLTFSSTQTLMNVLLTLMTVTLTLAAPTLWGASPVPVTLGSLGMEPHAPVRGMTYSYNVNALISSTMNIRH